MPVTSSSCGERQSTRVITVLPFSLHPLKQSPVFNWSQYTFFALRSGPCG